MKHMSVLEELMYFLQPVTFSCTQYRYVHFSVSRTVLVVGYYGAQKSFSQG